MKKVLLQKNGWVAMEIAREFLQLSIGDRIPTVSFFCEKYDIARGTVQIALKLLRESGAISLNPRGTLGTFVEKINYSLLLELADIKTIVGVMPLPYSKLYEGLATGIYQSAKERNLPLYLAYMRGAENRVALLEDKRYSFAITSRLAAETLISRNHDILIAMNFGVNTYVGEHGIIFYDKNNSEIQDGMRVGIDYSSIDQAFLTKFCCRGKTVQYVEIYYSQILEKLKNGEIDVAVWNIDDLKNTIWKNHYVPVKNDKYAKMNTETVLVVNKKEEYIGHILTKFINKKEVLEIQNKVLNDKMIPSY